MANWVSRTVTVPVGVTIVPESPTWPPGLGVERRTIQEDLDLAPFLRLLDRLAFRTIERTRPRPPSRS